MSLRPTRLGNVGITWLVVALGCVGCPAATAINHGDEAANGSAAPGSNEAPDPLDIGFKADEFSGQPQALERIRRGPFQYFRYIAGPFAQSVCDANAAEILRMPTVNLHGDAHVEQYAIADDGFGIVDFDDATLGPPLLDWLRFSTSLWLADKGGEIGARTAIARFVEGYKKGLADPEASVHAREPAVARRVREHFNTTPLEWLDRVTALCQPLVPADQEKMKSMRTQYIAAMLAQNPELGESFFNWKAGGLLQMGIGSTHEAKFLVRVEGPTKADADDVILEKKEMKAKKLGRCARGNAADPTRVVAAQSKFARSPQRLLGYVSVAGANYYVHAWRVHYTEIGTKDMRDGGELAEVAYDFGLQLGRGHPLLAIETEQGKKERAAILAALNEVEPTLAEVSLDLARRTRNAYQHFVRASAPPAVH